MGIVEGKNVASMSDVAWSSAKGIVTALKAGIPRVLQQYRATSYIVYIHM